MDLRSTRRPPSPLLAVALAVVIPACAARVAAPGPGASPASGLPDDAAVPKQVVEIDPIKISVVRPGQPGQRTAVVEVGALFESAGEHLRAGRFTLALAAYDELLADFSASRFTRAARYNSGLALQGLGRFADAAARFRQLAGPPGAPLPADAEARGDLRDALFQLAACQAETLDWRGSAEVLDRLLGGHQLGAGDRIEALARRGLAALRLGDEAAAELLLERALAFAASNRGVERVESDFFLAMASYHLALIVHGQLRRLPIRLPEKVMAGDLEAKAALVLKAQARYIRTIRVGNAHWATAAGYQIASLFEELHGDLVRAPVPAGVRGELLTVYHQELVGKLRPLIERALRVHEKNLDMAKRVGVKNAWVARSAGQLDRLRRLLDPAAARRAPEVLPAVPPPRDPTPARRDYRPRTIVL
jgi:tetratricopeptide (TPR) repeat protein